MRNICRIEFVLPSWKIRICVHIGELLSCLDCVQRPLGLVQSNNYRGSSIKIWYHRLKTYISYNWNHLIIIDISKIGVRTMPKSWSHSQDSERLFKSFLTFSGHTPIFSVSNLFYNSIISDIRNVITGFINNDTVYI